MSANTTHTEPVELSVAEAAARHGVDHKTIRRAIARGDLAARRIGPVSYTHLDVYKRQQSGFAV